MTMTQFGVNNLFIYLFNKMAKKNNVMFGNLWS